jgi:hypothetical protein
MKSEQKKEYPFLQVHHLMYDESKPVGQRDCGVIVGVCKDIFDSTVSSLNVTELQEMVSLIKKDFPQVDEDEIKITFNGQDSRYVVGFMIHGKIFPKPNEDWKEGYVG